MICSCNEFCGSSSSDVLHKLLSICPELRTMILEELLWQKDPFDCHETPLDFHPAILATCKQLHDEGIAVFYSNTIRYPILHQDKYTDAMILRGHGDWMADTPEPAIASLLNRISKLEVDVEWYHDINGDQTWRLQMR